MSVQVARTLFLTLCLSVTVLWSPNPDQDPRKHDPDPCSMPRIQKQAWIWIRIQ
jgi:hypothetical protein